MSALPWRIRPAVPDDVADLKKLWLSSFERSHYGRRFRTGDGRDRNGGKLRYQREHGARIARLLQRSDVRIACHPQDDAVWFGFAVLEGDVIHYVFAKRSWHREHLSWEVMRDLLKDKWDKPCTYTHELVELSRREAREDGARVPEIWLLDEYALGESEAA